MKTNKLSILLAVLLIATAFAGLSDWQSDLADQKVYKELRADAKEALADKKYSKAYELYLTLADTAHCERLPAVKACQLNNAALALIWDKQDKEGLLTTKEAKKCLRILNEAKALNQKICGTVIDKNIAYCKERIELGDGDK